MKKFNNIEEMLKAVGESQEFEPDDELTQLIRETEEGFDDELSLDELDNISAASNIPDISRLKEYIDKDKN